MDKVKDSLKSDQHSRRSSNSCGWMETFKVQCSLDLRPEEQTNQNTQMAKLHKSFLNKTNQRISHYNLKVPICVDMSVKAVFNNTTAKYKSCTCNCVDRAPFCVSSWASLSRQWKMALRLLSSLWVCCSSCMVWGSVKLDELSNSGEPAEDHMNGSIKNTFANTSTGM